MKLYRLNPIIILILFALSSCVEDFQSVDPSYILKTSTFPSIDSLIEKKAATSPDKFYVAKGNFDDDEIFIFKYCCAFCQGQVELYDAKGKLLCSLSNDIELSTSFCLYSENEIETSGVYWRPRNLDCFLE